MRVESAEAGLVVRRIIVFAVAAAATPHAPVGHVGGRWRERVLRLALVRRCFVLPLHAEGSLLALRLRALVLMLVVLETVDVLSRIRFVFSLIDQDADALVRGKQNRRLLRME